MAVVKYCAGFAALLALAAAAPTPQIAGGFQNDVVNVVQTDTDIDVDYDFDHDHYDHDYYEHHHRVDPDPLHHVYYENGHWHKRDAAPQIAGGIQNDVVNVAQSKTDIDVDVDYDDDHYDHHDHYYEHHHNVDPDPLHHVYYETGHWHKREAAPQTGGGVQNDVVNVARSDKDIDIDIDYDYDYDNHYDHYDHHDHYYDHHHNVDPDPLHHVYYETGHWHKREAAPQIAGGIQNDVVNVVQSDTDVDIDVDADRHDHYDHYDHHDYDDHFDYWASQDPDHKHKYYPDDHWHKN